MDSFGFSYFKNKLTIAKRELLVSLSVETQNYFFSSFRNQGFDGNPWKEVQRRIPETKAYKYPKTKGLQRRTSPILVGAGYKKRGGGLAKSVSQMSQNAEFIGNTTIKMIVNVPYAEYLNEGTENMVARPFAKQTAILTSKQTKTIAKVIDKVFAV